MATTPRNIRFDDDLYKEIKALVKYPFSAAYHIQEACRQYLESKADPVKIDSSTIPAFVKPKKFVEVAPDCDEEFDQIWAIYGRKGNKKTSRAKYSKLSAANKEAILKTIHDYVISTPDKQYRKNLETYINQECWNDEVIPNAENNRPNQPRRSSVVDRAHAAADERERARQARANDGPAMAEIAGDIRPSAQQPVRGDDTGQLGTTLDGTYRRTD